MEDRLKQSGTEFLQTFEISFRSEFPSVITTKTCSLYREFDIKTNKTLKIYSDFMGGFEIDAWVYEQTGEIVVQR
jgi:hypothetical protein